MKELITLLFFIFTFCLQNAYACRPGPFEDALKSEAEVIFIGDIISYKKLKKKTKDKVLQQAEVIYSVDETLKGSAKKKIKFIISQNIDTSIPKDLKAFISCYGKKSEVGVKKSKSNSKLLRVVQGSCHPPYILPIGKPKPTICMF